MNKSLVATCIILSIFIVNIAHAETFKVEHAGALKNFMWQGDISAKFSLGDLKNKKGVYALGAIEKLKGEIQIFDGIPFNSFVSHGKLEFDSSFDKNASLVVYAQVAKWQDSIVPKQISTYEQLEEYIRKIALERNINIEKPFPFLINGTARSVSWHVINWDENDNNHTHRKHIESGLNGKIKNVNVAILGFYSSKHKAIFTHHTTNMHIHYKTGDNKIAGHVDDLILGSGMTLKMPKLK